ncbi:sensor histidine kinase [Halobacterium sp. PCN9]|uniref:histidine kinase n=2 Tax=Halobacterium bonnevillei TaxID=2692200 RepID=A0A6B0SJM9_9EURY|nr:sensor histidine kinase [Halobacterium bonnevillei]
MTGIVAGLSTAERRDVVGDQYGDREYIKRALAGETYVSEPIEAASGNEIVTVSAPIVRDGAVVGALNAAFHLSDAGFFARPTENVDTPKGVTVRSASGRVIYSDQPMPDSSLEVYNATLEETSWTISVAESRTLIEPTMRRVTVLQFLGVFVVVASLAGFGWWNYRRNLKQVERLLDGFAALEDGDYGVAVDIGGAEEWDRIGAGFNEMSATVEQSLEASRERARQLQVLDRLLRHNLRNELNVVRGRAELLLTDDPGDVTEHAERIVRRCDALLESAEKERAINRVIGEGTTVESVDVPAVVESAVDGVADDYPEATVEVDAPASAPASAVPYVETAVHELVENAVEHADAAHASVAVSVDASDSTVAVSVADSGPGIPEMERRVLDGRADIDALHHSQGLGLWLVYWIVDRSGGSLEFADNDPAGSVVTIEFPRADE